MAHPERRRHFFINKPLQLRYMLVITFTLLVVTFVALIHIYFGIWGGILDAFSNEKIRNDLLTASRIQEYEEARHSVTSTDQSFSTFSLFRQAERLSQRQREVFRDLLNQTNQNLIGKLLILLALIAWGSVFLSHKVAGPLYRFENVLHHMIQGNLAIRCRLRKFDEAKLIGETFNHALEFLDFEISLLKNIVRENEKNPERLVARLKEELSKFKTSSDVYHRPLTSLRFEVSALKNILNLLREHEQNPERLLALLKEELSKLEKDKGR